MSRTFLILLALGLWANAAATIVHAELTSTSHLASIDEKLGHIERSLAALAGQK